MQLRKAKSVEALIEAAVRGELGEKEVRLLCEQAPELITLAFLAAGKRIAELQGPPGREAPSPSTPSAMVPVYEKPSVKKRCKKPGARNGHPGHRREQPKKITAQESHQLTCCPDCPT